MRLLVVAVVALLLLTATGGYILWTAKGQGWARQQSPAGSSRLAALTAQPHLLFLRPNEDNPFQNQLEIGALEGPLGSVSVGMTCVRVHYAGGWGVCAGTTALGDATVFDRSFHLGPSIQLQGTPSRVRVAPSGRVAADTVFVQGDGYAFPGFFSTRTTIRSLPSGSLFDLESLAVTRDGEVIRGADFNFWGVTFEADSDGFYATLGTAGHTYLIHGTASSRRAQVLRDGVECPSLSADGTHIVYKSRVPGHSGVAQWRLHVLDLRTMTDTALGETRDVDDQAEWLDNKTVLYALRSESAPHTTDRDLWSIGIATNSKPELFLRHAMSPAVVRPS